MLAWSGRFQIGVIHIAVERENVWRCASFAIDDGVGVGGGHAEEHEKNQNGDGAHEADNQVQE